MSVCFQIGVPRANQDFICLLWGISGGTSCFNDDRVIGLRNLVTERVVIGLCDHVTERDARPLNSRASPVL